MTAMKIVYQGKPVETSAASVAAFLEERGVGPDAAIVEYCGEIHCERSDLSSLALSEGAELNVFQIVSGG